MISAIKQSWVRDGEGWGRVLFLMERSRKASLRRRHLSRDKNEERELAM